MNKTLAKQDQRINNNRALVDQANTALLIILALSALALQGCGSQKLGKNLLNAASASFNSTGEVNGAVFIKSPVYAAQSNIGYTLGVSAGNYTVSPATPINYDNYLTGVAITGTIGGYLQNADINVKTDYVNNNGYLVTSSLQRARPNPDGKWFFSSVNDPNHKLGQLMAFYWINREKEVAQSSLNGSWHVSGKNVSVYSYCYDANGTFSKNNNLGPNAFWAGRSQNFACMSYLGPFESAFDASVYNHEMGHANVDYGTNGQIAQGSQSVSCANGGDCCPSANGCSGAINEGQADVHSYFISNSSRLGEFFINRVSGLTGRDGEANAALTAQQAYNTSPEIHNMGGVWGAAWWTLKKNLGQSVTQKIFFAHLELLNGNDSFKTALNAILSADASLVANGNFSSSHRAIILSSFSVHGITP